MKKLIYVSMSVALCLQAALWTGCDKPEKQDEDNGKSDVVYDADAQKTKLQDIALEFMGKFNPDDQKQAVQLADYLGGLYEDYDWDFSEVKDHYKGDYGFLYNVNRDVRRVASGNITSNFATDLFAKNAKGSDVKVYKFANINAVWEANEAQHKWEYKGEGAGGLLLKFKGPAGVQCEAKLWGEDGTVTYKGTYEMPNGKYFIAINGREMRLSDAIGKEYYDNDKKYEYEGEKYWVSRSYDYEQGDYYYYIYVYDKRYVSEADYRRGRYEYDGNDYWVDREYEDQPIEATLPKNVHFYLKEGSTEHINYAMDFDVQKSDHFNFDYTVQITNITVACGAKISKNAAGCVYSLKRGNDNLLRAVVDLKNCGLIDKANYQDWEDWVEMYDEMWDNREIQLGSAVAQMDILDGKLSIKTSTTDGTQFLKNIDALEEKYEAADDHSQNWWERYWNQAPFNKDWAKLLNKFMAADLYYGDSKSVQAQLKWDAYYEDREVWNYQTNEEEMHQLWDYAPMIYFPSDETSYNFGKYFTEKAFNRVINSAEDFINSYIHLSKRWGDGVEIEF